MNVCITVAASCILLNLCEMSHEEIVDAWLTDVQDSAAVDRECKTCL